MLLQRLLLLMPETGPAWHWSIWAAFIGLGMALWMLGARFSQSLICLTLVTVGALSGKYLPQLLGWKIDLMAAVLGGALIFGVLGYACHRAIMAFAFALLLAVWTALGAWTMSPLPTRWTWPAHLDLAALAELKTALGSDLLQEIGGLTALAAISGIAAAILFPKAAVTLFWTLLGASIALGASLAGCFYLSPARLNQFPQATQAQLIVLAAVVVVGWAIQAAQVRSPGTHSPTVPAAPSNTVAV